MPQRKGEKPNNAPTEIDRLEWCFEGCPDDELRDCWLYEFAREIWWLKEIVERRRKPVTLRNGQQSQIDTLTHFARKTHYSFLLRPDWPTQPYLSASTEERQKWIEWTRLQTEQESLANSLVPVEVPKGIEEQLAACLQNVGGFRRPRVRSKDNLTELALVLIDWTLPDSFLTEAFESYIKEFRPLVPNSPMLRRTGKAEPDSMRARQLEQLGRFRLLRANRQNVKLALAAAAGHLKSDSYSWYNSWYRARREVKQLLRNAETQIIPGLSRVELENFTSLNTPSKRRGNK